MTSYATTPSLGPLRPAWWWYVIAAAIMLGGIVLGVQRGLTEASRISDTYTRFPSNTDAQVKAIADDTHTVFAVFDDGRPTTDLEQPQVNVSVRTEGGEQLPVRPADGNVTFSDGRLAAVRVATFVPQDSGTVRVRVETADRSVTHGAVGSLDFLGAAARVLTPIVIGFTAGMLVYIVVLIARIRAKRDRRRIERDTRPELGVPTGAGSGPITFG